MTTCLGQTMVLADLRAINEDNTTGSVLVVTGRQGEEALIFFPFSMQFEDFI